MKFRKFNLKIYDAYELDEYDNSILIMPTFLKHDNDLYYPSVLSKENVSLDYLPNLPISDIQTKSNKKESIDYQDYLMPIVNGHCYFSFYSFTAPYRSATREISSLKSYRIYLDTDHSTGVVPVDGTNDSICDITEDGANVYIHIYDPDDNQIDPGK